MLFIYSEFLRMRKIIFTSYHIIANIGTYKENFRIRKIIGWKYSRGRWTMNTKPLSYILPYNSPIWKFGILYAHSTHFGICTLLLTKISVFIWTNIASSCHVLDPCLLLFLYKYNIDKYFSLFLMINFCCFLPLEL